MNVAKVQMRWQIGGNVDTWSVLHVKAADSHAAFTEDDLLDIAVAFSLWWRGDESTGDSYLSSMFVSEVVLEEIIVTRIHPTESAPLSFIVGDAGTAYGHSWKVPYGISVQSSPPQCSWLVTLRTSEASRRGRGRVFLPSTEVRRSLIPLMDETQYAIGRIPPQARDTLALCFANIFQLLSNTGAGLEFFLAVYSAVAVESYAVTSFDICDFLRTQRRRGMYPGTRQHYGLTGV